VQRLIALALVSQGELLEVKFIRKVHQIAFFIVFIIWECDACNRPLDLILSTSRSAALVKSEQRTHFYKSLFLFQRG